MILCQRCINPGFILVRQRLETKIINGEGDFNNSVGNEIEKNEKSYPGKKKSTTDSNSLQRTGYDIQRHSNTAIFNVNDNVACIIALRLLLFLVAFIV